MKAVQLFLKYGRNSAATRRDPVYPSRAALRQWVAEYEATDCLHEGYRLQYPKYTEEEKRIAVNYYLERGRYYLERGRNLRGTVRVRYPHRETLRKWLDEVDETTTAARRWVPAGDRFGVSMVPRLVGRGKPPVERGLQQPEVVASMVPRLVSRGKVHQQQEGAEGGNASMVPRLVSRGKGPTTPSPPRTPACFNGATAR